MIPNALTKSGVEADYWVHLKSIHHTLERLLSSSNLTRLEALDEDRLEALVMLLKGAIPTPIKTGTPDVSGLIKQGEEGVDYSSATDWKKRIGAVLSFEELRRSSKKGFDASVKSLSDTTTEFLTNSRRNLIPLNIPQREFSVLRDIIADLLAEAEIALNS